MIERLSIKEAAKKIGYTDLRSFKKWAKHNALQLFKDNMCKHSYVLKKEFEEAADQNVINQIKGISANSHQKVNENEFEKTGKYLQIGKDGMKIIERLLKISNQV